MFLGFTMPFPYSNIRTESAEQDHDDTETAPIGDEPRRSTFWTRLFNKIRALKWPMTFLLLFSILLCELSVLRRQPPILPIGAEINGLVPHCMSAIFDVQAHSR